MLKGRSGAIPPPTTTASLLSTNWWVTMMCVSGFMWLQSLLIPLQQAAREYWRASDDERQNHFPSVFTGHHEDECSQDHVGLHHDTCLHVVERELPINSTN